MRRENGESAGTVTQRVRQIDAASQRMLSVGDRLASAHRHALGVLFGENQRSLQRLEAVLGAGFAALFAAGAWGMRELFRTTIAPLRRQLVEAQALAERHEKLASLGVLAAGVAHEIRNPLTAIKARVFTLRRKLTPGCGALDDATIIDGEIDRLERIVSDFLIFARPGDPQRAAFAAGSLFSALRNLYGEDLAKRQIVLEMETAADELMLRADPQQLQQVLLNLVRNAAESIGQNGRIILRARRDRLSLHGFLEDMIVMEVQDTGAGIPPEVRDRLFDPFFTTKSAGTGLGLSIAMRIVERHGGALQFTTIPGTGTTFEVALPCLAPALPRSDGSAGAPVAAPQWMAQSE